MDSSGDLEIQGQPGQPGCYLFPFGKIDNNRADLELFASTSLNREQRENRVSLCYRGAPIVGLQRLREATVSRVRLTVYTNTCILRRVRQTGILVRNHT